MLGGANDPLDSGRAVPRARTSPQYARCPLQYSDAYSSIIPHGWNSLVTPAPGLPERYVTRRGSPAVGGLVGEEGRIAGGAPQPT